MVNFTEWEPNKCRLEFQIRCRDQGNRSIYRPQVGASVSTSPSGADGGTLQAGHSGFDVIMRNRFLGEQSSAYHRLATSVRSKSIRDKGHPKDLFLHDLQDTEFKQAMFNKFISLAWNFKRKNQHLPKYFFRQCNGQGRQAKLPCRGMNNLPRHPKSFPLLPTPKSSRKTDILLPEPSRLKNGCSPFGGHRESRNFDWVPNASFEMHQTMQCKA